MYQLKSLYNSPFKNSYSHPIHTCFAMIASNEITTKVTVMSHQQIWPGIPVNYQIIYMI